jgi:hypothetical protein
MGKRCMMEENAMLTGRDVDVKIQHC